MYRSDVRFPKSVALRKPSLRRRKSSFSRKPRTSWIFPWIVWTSPAKAKKVRLKNARRSSSVCTWPVAMLARTCMRKAGSEPSFDSIASGSLRKYSSMSSSTSSRSFAKRMASPYVSYFGRPARPHICLISRTGIGERPRFTSKRFRSRMITRRAGRLIPAARVGVATMQRIRPRLNSRSTRARCPFVRPALWKAAPPSTHFARRAAMEVGSSCSREIASATFARCSRCFSSRRGLRTFARDFARASEDRRVLTKMRACPPDPMMSETRPVRSSPSARISWVVLSTKYTRPS